MEYETISKVKIKTKLSIYTNVSFNFLSLHSIFSQH